MYKQLGSTEGGSCSREMLFHFARTKLLVDGPLALGGAGEAKRSRSVQVSHCNSTAAWMTAHSSDATITLSPFHVSRLELDFSATSARFDGQTRSL